MNTEKLVQLVLCLTKRGIPLPAIIEVATILGICWRRASGILVYFPGTIRSRLLPSRVGVISTFTPMLFYKYIQHSVRVIRFSDYIDPLDTQYLFQKIRKEVCRSIHPNGWILDLHVCRNWFTDLSNAWYCIDKKTETNPVWKPLRVVQYLSNHAPVDWTWTMRSTEAEQYEKFMFYWAEGVLALDSL